jgi:VIT family
MSWPRMAEPGDLLKPFKRALEPIDRVSEILFGLIMVLTFTGSLSVAEVGREDVRLMLVGALGCNLAWGIIDGIFFLMISMAEKSRVLLTYRTLRRSADSQQARQLIEDGVPPLLASVLTPAEFESMRQRLLALPEPPAHARLAKDDWLGALGTFLLVVLSTFPLTIPFMVMHDAVPAMRVSNAIAVVLLFFVGYYYGCITGRRPVGVGIVMVAAGLVLVAMTIALGG